MDHEPRPPKSRVGPVPAAPPSEPRGRATDSTPEITEDDRERLIARYGRKFLAGEPIFREGDPAREAFLLQEGRVRLLKRVRTVERSLLLLRPGDLFGESALVDAGARGSTAVALSDGVALAIDRSTFKSLFENHSAIAIRMFEQLVRRLRDAEDQIEIMLLRDTQLKVVSALLKLAHRASGAAEVSVSPIELSSRVGLDVDTVKRTVQRLREQQYLRISGERVEIPDVEALRRLYVLLGTKDEVHGDTAR